MKCLCGGRGWVVPKAGDWWQFCPLCKGHGKLSWTRLAKLVGVSAPTMRKIDRLEKVRRRSLENVLDKLLTMNDTVDRRQGQCR